MRTRITAKTLTFLLLVTVTLFQLSCADQKPSPTPEKSATAKKARPEKEKREKIETQKTKKAEEKSKSSGLKEEMQAGNEKSTKKLGKQTRAVPQAKRPQGIVPGKKPEVLLKTMSTLAKSIAFHALTGPITQTKDKIVALLPPPLAAAFEQTWKKKLSEVIKAKGVKNLDWIDFERGVKLAMNGKDNVLIMIPIKSKELLYESLPTGVQPTREGKIKYENAFLVPYEVKYGKFLMIVPNEQVLDEFDGDLKLTLARTKTDKILEATIQGKALQRFVSSALDNVERFIASFPGGSEGKDTMAKVFNFVRDIVADFLSQELSFEINPPFVEFGLRITAVRDSRLASFVSGISPGAMKAMHYLPDKCYLVMGQNISPAAGSPWMVPYTDIIASAWKIPDKDKPVLTKSYAQLLAATGEDTAFGLYTDEHFPFSASWVMLVKDGMQLRKALYEFYDLMFESILNTLPPENRQAFAGKSFKEFVDSIAPIGATFGILIEVKTEKYRGNLVDYFKIQFDYSKFKGLDNAPWLKTILGKSLSLALGFGPHIAAVAFGPHAIVRVKEILDGHTEFQPDKELGPEFSPGKYFMAGALFWPKFVSSLKKIGPGWNLLAKRMPWIEQLTTSDGIYFFGGVENQTLWIKVKAEAKSLIALIADIYAKQNRTKMEKASELAP